MVAMHNRGLGENPIQSLMRSLVIGLQLRTWNVIHFSR
jgi:hypothetical protein